MVRIVVDSDCEGLVGMGIRREGEKVCVNLSIWMSARITTTKRVFDGCAEYIKWVTILRWLWPWGFGGALCCVLCWSAVDIHCEREPTMETR